MCLALPGKVIAINSPAGLPTATIDFAGVRKQICIAYTPEAVEGDYVLVHVGFSLSIVNQEEAQKIFDTLSQINTTGEPS